jgi:hypothetical protein
MPREIVGKGLRFSLRHAPCAHICRYCLIPEWRKRSALPSNGRDDLEIGIFGGPSFDHDLRP